MCVVGSKALIASETVGNEPSSAVGEWMSDVYTPATNNSATACIILDLNRGESAKRITVELIYQDLNRTIHKACLFDDDITPFRTTDIVRKLATERFGTFEFHLNNVVTYQVYQTFLVHPSFCNILKH